MVSSARAKRSSSGLSKASLVPMKKKNMLLLATLTLPKSDTILYLSIISTRGSNATPPFQQFFHSAAGVAAFAAKADRMGGAEQGHVGRMVADGPVSYTHL